MNARILVFAVAALGLPCTGHAEALAGFAVAGNDELDRLRGGFTATVGGSAFEVSFGIDKAVFVNGELIAAAKLATSALTPMLVQNGSGNSFSGGTLPQPASNLLINSIQNSLDNQVIKQMTVIDAKVRSLEAFAANRFGAALNQQIFGSVR